MAFAEKRRLEGILASLPTTAAEDQALLEGGTVTGEGGSTPLGMPCPLLRLLAAAGPASMGSRPRWCHPHGTRMCPADACRRRLPTPAAADWCAQTILRFRIQRKRALRRALDALTSALGEGLHSCRMGPEAEAEEAWEENGGAAAATGEDAASDAGAAVGEEEAAHQEL